MENVTVTGTLKQVGNSLCLFIPAEVRDRLGLKPQEKVVAQIHKEKNKKGLLSLAGATRGKLGPWIEKEDRFDVRD
jgi:bifunctional DNA-binding transcriptional regulator/antitoxin component of YhaV-PrlF toxin-antitoxin module